MIKNKKFFDFCAFFHIFLTFFNKKEDFMRKRSYRRPGRPNLYESKGLMVLIVELGEVFKSYSEAAARIGGRRSGVHACLNGSKGRQTHMGYHFKLVRNRNDI